MTDRIERALNEHEVQWIGRNENGDIAIRCKCQPHDGATALRADWRHHVAEACTDRALRIY